MPADTRSKPGPKPTLTDRRRFEMAFPAYLLEQLEEEAQKREVSSAHIVREAVKMWLEKYSRKPSKSP